MTIPTRNQDGFTLIEMVMVIIIIGILAVYVTPRMDVGSNTVSLAAEIVASDLAHTQLTALNVHQSQSITLTPGASTYTYAGLTRDLTDIGSNITIGSGNALTFNSLGEPMGVAAQQSVTVTDGSVTKTITIEPYTGKHSIL